jgi:hypothetical protein
MLNEDKILNTGCGLEIFAYYLKSKTIYYIFIVSGTENMYITKQKEPI